MLCNGFQEAGSRELTYPVNRSGGKMVFLRMRDQPVLQCRVGNENMADEEIAENIQAVVRRIEGKLKRGIQNIKSIHLKTTMGTPVKVAM